MLRLEYILNDGESLEKDQSQSGVFVSRGGGSGKAKLIMENPHEWPGRHYI